jgi:predicted nucleic acid-binding protein
MTEAWAAYDRLFDDDRVTVQEELGGVEAAFRGFTRKRHASPRLWADAWLLAFAESAGGVVITLDRALAARARHTVLLG